MNPKLSNRYDWDALGNLVKKRMSSDDTGHDYAHVMRVLDAALWIAKPHRNINYDILVAACLMHDISIDVKDMKNHHIRSAGAAAKLLSRFGFSREDIARVSHAIINHNREFSNKGISKESELSMEAKILCDADKLDALGAIGIIRMINFSSRQGIPMFITKKDQLNDSVYGNIKYMVKIGTKMFTPQAKIIAWQRLQIMHLYNMELATESVSKR